jgi:hypothetical protein
VILETALCAARDYLNWGNWTRRHSTDPTWMPEVIRVPGSTAEMQWDRWTSWKAGDAP